MNPPHWQEDASTLEALCAKYSLTPIALLDRRKVWDPPGRLEILDTQGRSVTNLEIDLQFRCTPHSDAEREVPSTLWEPGRLLYNWLRGCKHHLAQLISQYLLGNRKVGRVSDEMRPRRAYQPKERYFKIRPDLRRFEHHPATGLEIRGIEGFFDESLFEASAFLGCAKRALNAIPLIFNCFPWSKGSTFGYSFHELAKAMTAQKRPRVPQELRDAIIATWNSWAKELVAYRDFIDHYGPLVFLPASTSMNALWTDQGLIGVEACLPDDPTITKLSDVTFSRNRDALSYAHRAYISVLRLTDQVLQWVERDLITKK